MQVPAGRQRCSPVPTCSTSSTGWIVRTAAHVLVFDYVEILPQGTQLPGDLRLTADSFDERRVVVFVSHGHVDHFSPVIQGGHASGLTFST